MVGTKLRDNAEIKSKDCSKQLLIGIGWYREKAKMIFRLTPGYPEKD